MQTTEFKLETIAKNIFESAGFTTSLERDGHDLIDLIAKRGGQEYYIDIKLRSSETETSLSVYQKSINRLCQLASQNNAIPVLVVFSQIKKESRQNQKDVNSKLIIIDIANLLKIVDGKELYTELVAALPYSIDGIEPEENEYLDIDWLEHADTKLNTKKQLIKRLENCHTGKEHSNEFEQICFDCLQYVFAEDLDLWKQQKYSNKNLYRFDLTCRIKDKNDKTIWSIIENYFNSKYIIFEFKNYAINITQKEIYTTEKYLYSKALRNVAVIIAKKGFESNAIWAAKGCFRESGKLILLFTVDELIRMIEIKANENDPSILLLEKLDSMLLELEK